MRRSWTAVWIEVVAVGCLVVGVTSHGQHHAPPANMNPTHIPRKPPVQLKPEQVQDAIKNSEDMKQHYEHVANIDFDTMTDRELNFHFFKLHDFDGNQMLDGLEIIKGLSHIMHNEDPDEQYNQADFDEIADHMLVDGDNNRDGYLTYGEYSAGNMFNQKNPHSIHNY